MLRHIRMTPPKEVHRLPSRLLAAVKEWAEPLYGYVVPHRTPSTAGEPDVVCHCRYPLYTLCSPLVSPYDAPSSAEFTVVNATGGGSSSNTSVVAAASVSAAEPVCDVIDNLPRTIHGDSAGSGASINSGGSSSAGSAQARYTSQQQRRRYVWKGRAHANLYQPNIVPHRRACYRCDICDGFQELTEEATPDGATSAPANQLQTVAPSLSSCKNTKGGGAGQKKRAGSTEDVEDGDEETEELTSPPRAMSADIATTSLEDTEVAQLRYLDPFLVEVIGRPSIQNMSRRFSRQLGANFKRCGTSAKELARRSPQLLVNANRYNVEYEDWVAATLAQQRQRRGTAASAATATTGAGGGRGGGESRQARVGALNETVALLDLSTYAVRFAIAVYGLPYELGYFNRFQDVAKLQAEPHRRYTCATSEEQMESMRRMLQGEDQDPLLEFALSRYSIRVGQSCFAVVLDHELRRVVVTFRGSLTMADAVVDVAEGYAEVDLLRPRALPLGVQSGTAKTVTAFTELSEADKQRLFRRTRQDAARRFSRGGRSAHHSTRATRGTGPAVSVSHAVEPPAEPLITRIPLGFYNIVRDAAAHLVPALNAIHDQYPDYTLVLTGHSLGAAQATLFHLLYCFPTGLSASEVEDDVLHYDHVHTITFGSPPLVETKVLSRVNARLAAEEARRGSRLVSYGFGKDPVARLQIRSIVDAFYDCSEVSTGTVSKGLAPAAAAATASANTSRGGSGGATAQGGKQKPASGSAGSGELSAAPAIPDSELPTLAVPGSFYNIPHTLRRSFFAVPETVSWRQHAILTPEAVMHHFPIFYVRGLNRIQHYYAQRLKEVSAGSTATLPPEKH